MAKIKGRSDLAGKDVDFFPTWADLDTFRIDEARRSSPSAGTTIVWIGRLDHQKNPGLAIEIFQEYFRVGGGGRLVIIGDGILKPKMMELISSSGHSERIELRGLLEPNEIASVLNQSDVLLMTSRYEGMPVTAIEALACGVPVVAPDVGELRRIVHNRMLGRVVSASAQVEDYVESIMQLTKQGVDRKSLAQSVEVYSAEVAARKLHAAYAGCL